MKTSRGCSSNPLFLAAEGEKGEDTFVTWGYARYRGRTELDMITPLYWHYTRSGHRARPEAPFPVSVTRARARASRPRRSFRSGPIVERYGVSETTFITPFFQHTHRRSRLGNEPPPDPLRRSQRDEHAHGGRAHSLGLRRPEVAHDGRRSRLLPLRDETAVSQLVGNVYYHEDKHSTGGSDWESTSFQPSATAHARRTLVERALRPGRLHAPRQPREGACRLDSDIVEWGGRLDGRRAPRTWRRATSPRRLRR